MLGQVPTLETPQGGVWESNAIARYVARLADKGLFGKTAIDMVRMLAQGALQLAGCPSACV